jgi:hypothetical protein
VPTSEIIAENFAPFRWLTWPRSSIRVVDWNIDRGLQLPAILDFLGQADADILLLQEVDVNVRRTQRLNIAREIAQIHRVDPGIEYKSRLAWPSHALQVEDFKTACN